MNQAPRSKMFPLDKYDILDFIYCFFKKILRQDTLTIIDKKDLTKKTFRLYISRYRIRQAIKKMAYDIKTHLDQLKMNDGALRQDIENHKILLVCVLNGAFHVTSDLQRELRRRWKIKTQIDFISIKTRQGETILEEPIFERMLKIHTVKDMIVFIVEDVIDSALTLNWLWQDLDEEKPKCVRFVSLLRKAQAHERLNSQLKKAIVSVGLEIANPFVIGYGLDLNQEERDLEDIFIKVKEQKLTNDEIIATSKKLVQT